MIGWQGRILAALHLSSSYYGEDFIPSFPMPRDPRQMNWKLWYCQALIAIASMTRILHWIRGWSPNVYDLYQFASIFELLNLSMTNHWALFCECGCRCKPITPVNCSKVKRPMRSVSLEKSELGKGSAPSVLLLHEATAIFWWCEFWHEVTSFHRVGIIGKHFFLILFSS